MLSCVRYNRLRISGLKRLVDWTSSDIFRSLVDNWLMSIGSWVIYSMLWDVFSCLSGV